MMRAAAPFLLFIVGLCPIGVRYRLSRELLKGLAQEFRAGQTPVNRVRLPAADRDGRNARQLLNLGGEFKAVSIGAQSPEQTRSQGSSGPGKAGEQSEII